MAQDQTDLFRPAARNSDPSTSHEAETKHEALGKRAERMRQVLRLVGAFPGNTTGELSRHMLQQYPELPFRTCAETPHKRVTDLEHRGLVRRGKKRVCRDSGNVALTWYVTDTGFDELME